MQNLKIKTQKGNALTSFLIAADGANSKVKRILAYKNNIFKAPAVEYEIPYNNITSEKELKLRFDLGIPRQGYAWVFPKRNFVSVGLGLFL